MPLGRLVGWTLGALLTLWLLRAQRCPQDRLRLASQLVTTLGPWRRCS